MINLIKNELYKIFHKKGIYIVLIITLLYILLTNVIYNSSFMNFNAVDDTYEMELYFIKTLEEADETKSEEYINSKIYIATYDFAMSFGKDSWQRYILMTDEEYSTKINFIFETIVKYELKHTNNKSKYDEAVNAKKEIEKELKELSWKDFVQKDIEKTKEQIKVIETKEAKYLYQAKLDALNLRLKYNIEYGYDEFNEYINIYENNKSTYYSYKNIDEDLLKKEEKATRDYALKEYKLAEYKIENNIKQIPYGSNHYIFTSFYSEYFTMLLVIIVLVSGCMVSEEFSKGTIKLLLVKPYTRTKILLGKYLTVLLMILFAIVVTFIMQFIVGGIFFGYDSLSIPYIVYDLGTNSIKALHVLKYFLLLTIAILPQLILLGTLAFALSTITTSTSLTNTLTIIGAFGSSIFNAMAEGYELVWAKYVVTLNWDFSCYLFGGASPYKGVTLPFSVMICIIYLIVMLVITFVVFKKKNIKNI